MKLASSGEASASWGTSAGSANASICSALWLASVGGTFYQRLAADDQPHGGPSLVGTDHNLPFKDGACQLPDGG